MESFEAIHDVTKQDDVLDVMLLDDGGYFALQDVDEMMCVSVKVQVTDC